MRAGEIHRDGARHNEGVVAGAGQLPVSQLQKMQSKGKEEEAYKQCITEAHQAPLFSSPCPV